jgi:hypothetical protein
MIIITVCFILINRGTNPFSNHTSYYHAFLLLKTNAGSGLNGYGFFRDKLSKDARLAWKKTLGRCEGNGMAEMPYCFFLPSNLQALPCL